MSTVAVLNTDAGLTGKTIDLLESAQTITGVKTFNLAPAAPFAVTVGSAKVANLDADKLDGLDSTAFLQKDISAVTDGQLLIGKTSDHSLNLAAITAGSNITVTNGAGVITIAAASSAMTLLKANSGTDTAAGATNVDTIAITGLTAKDLLLVKVDAISMTQATANIGLYNSTDSVALNTAVASLAAGATTMLTFDVAQSQASATTIWTRGEGKDTVPTVYGTIVIATFTQNWTGSWTLALRHGGVTAGGTLQWRWSVYKLAGQ